jgi:hypothetical protein
MSEAFGSFAGVKFRSLSVRPAAPLVVGGTFYPTIHSGKASSLPPYALRAAFKCCD